MSANQTVLPEGLTLEESSDQLIIIHKPAVSSGIVVAVIATGILASVVGVDWFVASVQDGILVKILLNSMLLVLGLALVAFAIYSVIAWKVNTDRCTLDREMLRRESTPLNLFGDALREIPVSSIARLYITKRRYSIGVELGYIDREQYDENRVLLVPDESSAFYLKQKIDDFLSRQAATSAPESTDH